MSQLKVLEDAPSPAGVENRLIELLYPLADGDGRESEVTPEDLLEELVDGKATVEHVLLTYPIESIVKMLDDDETRAVACRLLEALAWTMPMPSVIAPLVRVVANARVGNRATGCALLALRTLAATPSNRAKIVQQPLPRTLCALLVQTRKVSDAVKTAALALMGVLVVDHRNAFLDAIEPLGVVLDGCRDPEARHYACCVLLDLGRRFPHNVASLSDTTIPAVTAMVDYGSKAAVLLLRFFADQGCFGALAAAEKTIVKVLQDDDPDQREAAARACVTRSAVPRLAGLLDDRVPKVCEGAACALALIKESERSIPDSALDNLAALLVGGSPSGRHHAACLLLRTVATRKKKGRVLVARSLGMRWRCVVPSANAIHLAIVTKQQNAGAAAGDFNF